MMQTVLLTLFLCLSLRWGCLAEQCGNNSYVIYKSGVEPDDIEMILKMHNDKRQQVASGNCTAATGSLPSACNMAKMTWDDKLAKWAQIHANGCEHEHWNPALQTNTYYGQNLFMKWSSSKEDVNSPDWSLAISYWADEDKFFNESFVDPFEFNYEAGHFTQLVWANTYQIGCGATWFLNTSEEIAPYRTLYTCQYSPGGNVISRTMYKTEDCEACNLDTGYPNLCQS